jgi:hypothetical protein
MLVFFAVEDRSSARLRRGVGFEARGRSACCKLVGGRRSPALASKDAETSSLGERRDVWADARQDVEGFLESRHLLVDKRTPGAQG